MWGALSPCSGATFFCYGDVTFAINNANDLGGARSGHKSATNVTGTTTWEDNTSLNTGGGVAMLESTFDIVAGSNARISNITAKI